jgi:hypothetical protein
MAIVGIGAVTIAARYSRLAMHQLTIRPQGLPLAMAVGLAQMRAAECLEANQRVSFVATTARGVSGMDARHH